MSVKLTGESADGVRIRLNGILDEGFDYTGLTLQLRGNAVLDLEGVRRITSFGVARWRVALAEAMAETKASDSALGREATAVSFVRCPPCMMTQFNIIRQFDCGGTLVSVYLPYLCPQCGEEQRVLYDRRGRGAFVISSIAETIHCANCNGTSEFDDVPEVYFEYLLHAPVVGANPVRDHLIDAPESSDG